MGWKKVKEELLRIQHILGPNVGTKHVLDCPELEKLSGPAVAIVYPIRTAVWREGEMEIPTPIGTVDELQATLVSVDNKNPLWYLEYFLGRANKDYRPFFSRTREPGIGMLLKLLNETHPAYLDYEVGRGHNSHVSCGCSEEYLKHAGFTPEMIPHLESLAEAIGENNLVWEALDFARRG
jgi:hypothetical protein